MATMMSSGDSFNDDVVTNIYLRKGSSGKFNLNFDIEDDECTGVEICLNANECAKLITLLQTVAKEEKGVTNIENKVR